MRSQTYTKLSPPPSLVLPLSLNPSSRYRFRFRLFAGFFICAGQVLLASVIFSLLSSGSKPHRLLSLSPSLRSDFFVPSGQDKNNHNNDDYLAWKMMPPTTMTTVAVRGLETVLPERGRAGGLGDGDNGGGGGGGGGERRVGSRRRAFPDTKTGTQTRYHGEMLRRIRREREGDGDGDGGAAREEGVYTHTPPQHQHVHLRDGAVGVLAGHGGRGGDDVVRDDDVVIPTKEGCSCDLTVALLVAVIAVLVLGSAVTLYTWCRVRRGRGGRRRLGKVSLD